MYEKNDLNILSRIPMCHALCPTLHAFCPIRFALCPMRYAPCPSPALARSISKSRPYFINDPAAGQQLGQSPG
jgi:hypothetical protein